MIKYTDFNIFGFRAKLEKLHQEEVEGLAS